MRLELSVTLGRLIHTLDSLSDNLYLAVEKKDGGELDSIGRDLTNLGQLVKDIGYEIGREGQV